MRLRHQLDELLEQIAAVVRAGGRFGMILYAEDRQGPMTHSLQRAIVEVEVRRLDAGGQLVEAHGEPVVLRRDLDAIRQLVQNRLIGATVAELQLERLAAQRQSQQLMPQADPEYRFLRLD